MIRKLRNIFKKLKSFIYVLWEDHEYYIYLNFPKGNVEKEI